MKKHLILVKHSPPEIVRSLPAREWKLSEEGRIRARRLAEHLDPLHPEVIISSVEPKAKETAEIIANQCNLEFHVADGLHEHDRSRVAYLPHDQFQAAIHEFFGSPDALVFGSETANETHARFYQAVNSVLNMYVDRTIVIVAHGTVISLFVSRLTGISDFLLWNELGLPAFLVIDMQLKELLVRENITAGESYGLH